MLRTENWLYNFPGSALKVPVVEVVGGGYKVKLVIDLGYNLALAKPTNLV